MKIAVAQIKYKTADFDFNYENIIKYIENTDSDLIVFPAADIESTGGKDLIYDEVCQNRNAELFNRIAAKSYKKTVLIGNILIKDGESEDVEFFEYGGKKVFVTDEFVDDVICDIYILSKNRYFVMRGNHEFSESINSKFDFIYINSIGMADENIFAGGSFAKNNHNEYVCQLPLCEEKVEIIDFDSPQQIQEENFEESIFKVITFALREYCENTGFKKVILGLSG